jgi:hypothetical protein
MFIAPHRAINQTLRMFNTYAYGKALGLNAHTTFGKHAHSVARAVADSQDNKVGCKLFAGNTYAAHPALLNHKIIQARVKPKLNTPLLQALDQGRNNAPQTVGTDMRTGIVENVAVSAAGDQFL